MKTLTFAFDVQLHDNEDWIKEGTVVSVSDTWRQHEGFTPVIITEGFSYSGKHITIQPAEEVFFMNECFVELR